MDEETAAWAFTFAKQALALAVDSARRSRCQKSQRGVVLWVPAPGGQGALIERGWNYRADLGRHGPRCDGSDACRAACGRLCIHAEQDALDQARGAQVDLSRAQMLHVKTVDGEPVPSGRPSCWQCSRAILAAGVRWMWLLHEDGLRAYHAGEFHRLTLNHHGISLPGSEAPSEPKPAWVLP